MIEPDKNIESKDESLQVAEIILDILEVDDIKSVEFRRKINEMSGGISFIVSNNTIFGSYRSWDGRIIVDRFTLRPSYIADYEEARLTDD